MLSNSWSIYVIVLAVGNILAMLWLLLATSKGNDIDETDTTGHKWDGIEELNNPLPRWWFGLFVLTIVFSGVYLYLYPGLGSYEGSLSWSQTSAFEEERHQNELAQSTFFAEFVDFSVSELAKDDRAMETGARLFSNNCATCHGSDARGAKGFPNLTDQDWLYGDDAESIVASITNGRAGVMPKLPGINVPVLARYVRYLSGDDSTTEHVKQTGPKHFTICAACHGATGQGNTALGAPNLTDDVWLHGGRVGEIEQILYNGINGNMPSFSSLLNENEIRLLAAYVLSLSSVKEEHSEE